MNQVNSISRSSAARNRRQLAWLLPVTVVLVWVVGWTVIFSALDFWSIKLYDVCHASWFQQYRAIMRYGVSWISPPSFALAENAYFIWMNMYDRDYRMYEWEWYSGNPINPDGHYNFVWGTSDGGWMRFPMKEWYGGWLLATIPWLLGVAVIFLRRRPPPIL